MHNLTEEYARGVSKIKILIVKDKNKENSY